MFDFHCAKFKSDITCDFKVLFVFFLLFVSFLSVFDCWGGGVLFVKNLSVSVDGFIHTEIQVFCDCSFKGISLKQRSTPGISRIEMSNINEIKHVH